MPDLQESPNKNLSGTEFNKVYKVSFFTKLRVLLRESGDFLHRDKEVAYNVTG